VENRNGDVKTPQPSTPFLFPLEKLEAAMSSAIQEYERKKAKPNAGRLEEQGTMFLVKLALYAVLLNVPGLILAHFFGQIAFVIWFLGVMLFFAGPRIGKLLISSPEETTACNNKNRELFHALVTSRFAQTVYGGYAFHPEITPPLAMIEATRFWEDKQLFPKCEGTFLSSAGSRQITCCEVRLPKSKEYDSAYDPLFQGALFSAACPAAKGADFLIKKDTTERVIGAASTILQGKGDEKNGYTVKIDNRMFEELFVVRSKTPNEAQRLLTPGFIEKLVALRIRIGDDAVACSLADGMLYLAIDRMPISFTVSSFNSSEPPYHWFQNLATCMVEFEELADEIG
jgi:hypothetical protein